MLHNQNHGFRRAVAQCLAGAIALALLTFFCFRLRLNLATAVCLYLIIIVLLSLQGSFLSSAVVSFIAVGCLAYFFAPPIFSFRVSDPFEIVMNLMVNGIEAMKALDGTRELAIKSQRGQDEQLMVSVSDSGVGLPPQQADRIFDAFFTTKPHGTGMGLRISRSIIESHGGRLWAADNSPRGASFYFTLPTKGETHE